MTNLVVNFHALLRAVVGELGEYKVYRTLKHDKNTVKRWLEENGQPDDPRDIGTLIRLALLNHIDVSGFQTFSSIYDFSPELSYEDNMYAGPPHLDWLWECQDEAPSYGISIGDLALDSPIGIGSSPLTGNELYTVAMLNLGFGLSTFKTRRAELHAGLERPQIAFVLQPPALLNTKMGRPPEVLVTSKRSEVRSKVPDIVNSIGVPSEAAAEWQKEYENIRQHPRGR